MAFDLEVGGHPVTRRPMCFLFLVWSHASFHSWPSGPFNASSSVKGRCSIGVLGMDVLCSCGVVVCAWWNVFDCIRFLFVVVFLSCDDLWFAMLMSSITLLYSRSMDSIDLCGEDSLCKYADPSCWSIMWALNGIDWWVLVFTGVVNESLMIDWIQCLRVSVVCGVPTNGLAWVSAVHALMK